MAELTRAQRRQLRKAMGKKWGREWRVFGHQTTRLGACVIPGDDLNQQIAETARTKGHAAQFRRPQ